MVTVNTYVYAQVCTYAGSGMVCIIYGTKCSARVQAPLAVSRVPLMRTAVCLAVGTRDSSMCTQPCRHLKPQEEW